MVADRLGVALELRDTSSDLTSRQELLDATGRTTVPVLRIEPNGSSHEPPAIAADSDTGDSDASDSDASDNDASDSDASDSDASDSDDSDARWLRESLAIIRYLKAQAGQPERLPVWIDRLSSALHTLSFMALVAGLLAGGPSGRSIAIGGGIGFSLSVMRRIASVLTARRVADEPRR